MTGYITKIDTFDNVTDNWALYCERIKQYFKANDIEGDKRVLLRAIGGKAYALLRSLTAPTMPADLSFDNMF